MFFEKYNSFYESYTKALTEGRRLNVPEDDPDFKAFDIIRKFIDRVNDRTSREDNPEELIVDKILAADIGVLARYEEIEKNLITPLKTCRKNILEERRAIISFVNTQNSKLREAQFGGTQANELRGENWQKVQKQIAIYNIDNTLSRPELETVRSALVPKKIQSLVDKKNKNLNHIKIIFGPSGSYRPVKEGGIVYTYSLKISQIDDIYLDYIGQSPDFINQTNPEVGEIDVDAMREYIQDLPQTLKQALNANLGEILNAFEAIYLKPLSIYDKDGNLTGNVNENSPKKANTYLQQIAMMPESEARIRKIIYKTTKRFNTAELEQLLTIAMSKTPHRDIEEIEDRKSLKANLELIEEKQNLIDGLLDDLEESQEQIKKLRNMLSKRETSNSKKKLQHQGLLNQIESIKLEYDALSKSFLELRNFSSELERENLDLKQEIKNLKNELRYYSKNSIDLSKSVPLNNALIHFIEKDLGRMDFSEYRFTNNDGKVFYKSDPINDVIAYRFNQKMNRYGSVYGYSGDPITKDQVGAIISKRMVIRPVQSKSATGEMTTTHEMRPIKDARKITFTNPLKWGQGWEGLRTKL